MGIDIARIDDIMEKKGRTPDMAIPILQAIQDEFRYVPVEAIEHIAKNSEMTEAQLYGVATFFAQFRLTPIGETIIKVCHGTACHVGGADGLTEALEARLGVKTGQNTPDMKFALTSVACLGCCSLAPVVMVDKTTYGRLDRKKVVKVIDEIKG